VRGFDGGKQVKGRKRHLVVDTLGLVMKAFVTEANYADNEVASWLMRWLPATFPRLRRLWADGGYRGQWLRDLPSDWPITVDITLPNAFTKGFEVIPNRWVVERTFAWLNHFRRLSKDYEYWVYTADTVIYIAMSRLMLARLAHP